MLAFLFAYACVSLWVSMCECKQGGGFNPEWLWEVWLLVPLQYEAQVHNEGKRQKHIWMVGDAGV